MEEKKVGPQFYDNVIDFDNVGIVKIDEITRIVKGEKVTKEHLFKKNEVSHVIYYFLKNNNQTFWVGFQDNKKMRDETYDKIANLMEGRKIRGNATDEETKD